MVRVKGLEPPRHRRQNLNLVRLPIPPHPHETAFASLRDLLANLRASGETENTKSALKL